MLNIITKSKVRLALLQILFFSGKDKYYLSELAKEVNASVGNVQRELNKLLEFGLIKTEKIGNLRFYSLNEDDPIFVDIKNLLRKTIGIEALLKKALHKISSVEFAFIFGSYAKDGLKSESDIDLFLVGEIDEAKLMNEISGVENKINREINYHIYKRSEFKKEVKSNSFLKNIIKNYLLIIGDNERFKKLFK